MGTIAGERFDNVLVGMENQEGSTCECQHINHSEAQEVYTFKRECYHINLLWKKGGGGGELQLQVC